MAKRRKLPDEDLAAAVADIINSPITRANLKFLGPEAPPAIAPSVPALSQPVGFSVKPMDTSTSTSAEPMGADVYPMGSELSTLGSSDAEPEGFTTKPMGSAESRRPVPAEAFPASRIRRIERPADALSTVEERVWRMLWQHADGSGPARLAQYSLQRISTEAGINIRTVRLLMPRLIEKGFAEVAAEADVRRNIPTTYRIFGDEAMGDRLRQQGRTHIVKTGRGVFYAEATGTADVKPMGSFPQPMGSSIHNPVAFTSSAPAPVDELADICRQAFGAEPDRHRLAEVVAACHQHAFASTGRTATEAEILYFARMRVDVIRRASNIRNHFAVLARALPECFSGPSFQAYRTNTSGL